VNDIKLKATSWQPREVHENHLRHVPVENVHNLFGSLGENPILHQFELGHRVFDYANDKIHKFANVFGSSAHNNPDSHSKLRGWADWDVNVDEDQDADQADDFVDPSQYEDREPVVIDDGEGKEDDVD